MLMEVEELIMRLASLCVSSSARKSNEDLHDQEGENTLQELRTYVEGVQHSVFKTEVSVAALKQIAKRDARSLLKIAHTGLRNSTGGVELLRLACDATQTLLPLSKFAGTAALVIEKLCYQAVARSVDLSEFFVGLRAAALLQTCLRQHGGGTAGTAVIPSLCPTDSAAGGPHSELFLSLDGGGIGDDWSRLYSFDAPGAEDSVEVAKLVSGASLNTCRCCLEVGSKEALELIGGGLGRSAGLWIDRVGELGEASKAEAYRDHLFKLLWRACSVSEQPGLALQARDCLAGRQTALELLIRQGSAWNTSAFVAHAHRAALSLERRGGRVDGTSSVGYAAQLSAFCYVALCSREGELWPAGEASGADNETQFHPGWVDWLQYAAGLQEKVEDGKEAQRLLQLAYDYVQRCSKRVSRGTQRGGIEDVASCAAYSGVLMMQASATITAHYALPHARGSTGVNAATPPPTIKQPATTRKQPAKPNGRAGMRASDDACPASTVHSNICRALEHLDTLRNYVGELSIAVSSGSKAAGEVDESVAAVVKAWKWAQKSCGITGVWVERVKEMNGVDDCELGPADWSALNERGLQVLADLSQGLMSLRRNDRPKLLEKIPSRHTLVDMAFDSYLRAAVVHVSILSSATHMNRVSKGRGAAAEVVVETNGALQSLMAAERLCRSEGDMISSQHTRRVGVAWFGLGQGLVDCGQLATGLSALVRGCRLLESWIESERGGGEAVGTNDGTGGSDVLHSAQLDLRLSKLSKALVELGEYEAASMAVARALAFCPELWTALPDGQLGPAAAAQALSERYVACRLRGAGTLNQKCQDPDNCSGEAQLVPAAATDVSDALDDAMAYLTDSKSVPGSARSKRNEAGDLTSQLRRRGVPASAVVWILLAECRAYRAQLPLHLSEGSQHTAREHSGTLTAFIEGHRQAAVSVLRICEATTKVVLAHRWEAHSHMLSAWFEHDIFLVDVAARKGLDGAESGAGAARLMADLPAGIQHAVRGFETTMKLGSEHSQSVAAIAGVCVCVHAILLRDLGDASDGVRDVMRNGLDLLGDALKVLNGKHEAGCMIALGPADASSIASCLEILERHYSLHRDTWRMIRSAELKLLLLAYRQATSEPADRLTNASMKANALSSIGFAYHQAGIPKLAASFCSAAAAELCELEATNDSEGQGAGFDDGNGSSGSPSSVGARAAADTLRGLCLAGQSERALEAERTLLGARSGVSGGGRVDTPETAAYLESVAGLGLSWIYERRGQLADALGELRQVLRLCHAWASCGGPLSDLDMQVVSLSAPTGASVHDEQPGTQGVAALSGLAEEGVGEESGEVEEAIGTSKGQDGRHHEGGGVLLSSRWLPVYLEGLARVGRLWRARGFASKASGYLRQGCVVSEPLRSASFLRRCLVEEVEVAMRMHRFDRADRLLHACQALLGQERRDQVVSDVNVPPALSCATCRARVALGSCPANTALTKGKDVKKGSKKGASKAMVPLIAKTIAPAEGICLRCHEFALNAAELLVTESDVLRRKGDFRGALAACEQGQAILAPLLEAASQGLQVDSSLSFEHGPSANDLKEDRGEGYGFGWRTLEILAKLRLHQGRASYLLGAAEAAIELLLSCAHSDEAPVLVRATALYRLGRIYLDAADAVAAMEPLQQAEVLSRGSGAPKLIRRVRRALAVALSHHQSGQWEQKEVGIDGSWKVAALSSLSIGVTQCNHVVHKAAGLARKTGRAAELGEASAGLRLFDVVSGGQVVWRKPTVHERRPGEEPGDNCGGACLSEAMEKDLREEWPIVTLCLTAGEGTTKHLLVTRLARGRPPLTASVPLSAEDTGLLKRWREIMDENRDTLRGHSADEAAAWGNKEKAAWWARRAAVDAAVAALVQELQEKWLEAHGLTPLIMGNILGSGLDVVLEGVYEFAKERIEGARRRSSGGVRGKDEMKRKGRTGTRRAAAAGNTAVSEPKSARASGILELVRVCVRAGDVMSERAWFIIVRLALCGVPDQKASAESIAGEIHKRVHAAFVAGGVVVTNDCEVNSGDGNVSGKPSAAESGKIDRRSSLEIEAGRSASDGPGRGDDKTAATPAAPSASRDRASVDETTLSKMKVADLRRELSARGVVTTGLKLKSDLLTRLTDALRQEADDGVRCRRSADGTRGTADRTNKTAPTVVSLIQDKGGSKVSHSIPRQEAMTPKDEKEDDNNVDLKGTTGHRTSTCGAQRHPVVLVLDEELQVMPWEALPCHRGRPVTRVPAVPFVFSALATRWDCTASSDTSPASGDESTAETEWAPSRDGIRANRGFYVLDPENNLSNTQQRLGQVFDELRRRLGWSGIVGEAPSEEAMARALQAVDIFAYCGHGAGELFVGREAVAGLARCPVAVLMGCSSGRLKGYGDFEPSGMVSSYLVGGSPAIVANLWDVTDRDIDRFSVALFDLLVGEEREWSNGKGRQVATLAHAVAEARSECKMAFIIGHAPVCYGIPVAVAEASFRH